MAGLVIFAPFSFEIYDISVGTTAGEGLYRFGGLADSIFFLVGFT
jgi:hypothetical protein